MKNRLEKYFKAMEEKDRKRNHNKNNKERIYNDCLLMINMIHDGVEAVFSMLTPLMKKDMSLGLDVFNRIMDVFELQMDYSDKVAEILEEEFNDEQGTIGED